MLPFPKPKNAQEIAWNCYPTISRTFSHDDLLYYSWFGLFKGTKYEKHFVWDLFNRKYRGRTDIPPLGDMPDFTERGICLRESIVISEPNEVVGGAPKSRKRRSWLPVILALGKSIHCRHFFKEQISVLLPEQDVTG